MAADSSGSVTILAVIAPIIADSATKAPAFATPGFVLPHSPATTSTSLRNPAVAAAVEVKRVLAGDYVVLHGHVIR
jgi:hypothetical protein